MGLIKYVGNYPGIVTLGGIKYDHDELTISIGMLCKNDVPDLESLRTHVENRIWPGSIEEFVRTIVKDLESNFDFKGVLVIAQSTLFNSSHTVVTGEVLQDFDVKQEMYSLLGIFGMPRKTYTSVNFMDMQVPEGFNAEEFKRNFEKAINDTALGKIGVEKHENISY